MKVDPFQLKNFLLESFLITKKQLEKAEEESQKSGQKLEETLVKLEWVKEEEITRLKAYILGIPFIDLAEEKIPPKVITIIPEDVARKENAVVFRQNENNLEVALLDPENLHIVEFLREKTGLKISPRLTSEAGIQNALSQYPKGAGTTSDEFLNKETKTTPQTEEKERKLSAEKIADTLIKHANLEKASDIQIERTKKELVVRYLTGDILKETLTLPENIAPEIMARFKTLADSKSGKDEKIESITILPGQNGEKITIKMKK